ncbi:MAG: hypothetical protein ABI194_02250 [Gemmatimonadaceae bacterium]
MDIHTPKHPVHGWREFLKEVGIIVLGVLLALGAEQTVEWLHWRQQVQITDDALQQEIRRDLRWAYERRVYEQCQNGRIAQLRDKLLQPASRWTTDSTPVDSRGKFFSPTAMPRVYQAPLRPYETEVWDVALAGTALIHMPRARAALYAKLYNTVALLRGDQAREEELGPRLAPLGFDRTLSAPERTAFLATLGELADLNQVMAGAGGQFIDMASSGGDGMRLTRATADTVVAHAGHCAQAVAIPLARE